MRNSLSAGKGQTLVEMIVALAVAILIITSLVAGTVTAVRNAGFAKNQSLATKYAVEGMEEARIYRDQNGWDKFWTDKVSSTEGPAVVGSIFLKTIEYKDVSEPVGAENRAQVTVIVSWTEGGRTHKSELTTYLTKWK